MHGTCEEGPKWRRRVSRREDSTKVQLPQEVESQSIFNMRVPLSKHDESKLEFLSSGKLVWTNHSMEEDTSMS